MGGEARLPWRVGQELISGRYSEAVNLLTEWIVLTVHDAPLHFAVETALVLFVLGLILFRRKPRPPMGGGLDLDPKVRSERERGANLFSLSRRD